MTASPLRWGNEGRPLCMHLWTPCAVSLIAPATERVNGQAMSNRTNITYKICINCRKVLM